MASMLIICTSNSIAGAKENARPPLDGELDISVKFDHTFYHLELMQGVFGYQQGGLNFRFASRDCNQGILTRFTRRYTALLRENSMKKVMVPTQYDVEVTPSVEPKFNVPRGSTLGDWLRDVPKNITYLIAEAKLACKK